MSRKLPPMSAMKTFPELTMLMLERMRIEKRGFEPILEALVEVYNEGVESMRTKIDSRDIDDAQFAQLIDVAKACKVEVCGNCRGTGTVPDVKIEIASSILTLEAARAARALPDVNASVGYTVCPACESRGVVRLR